MERLAYILWKNQIINMLIRKITFLHLLERRTYVGILLEDLHSSWSHTGYTDAHQSLPDSGTVRQTVWEKDGHNIMLCCQLDIRRKADVFAGVDFNLATYIKVHFLVRHVCGMCSTLPFHLWTTWTMNCSTMYNKEGKWSNMHISNVHNFLYNAKLCSVIT